MDIMNWMLVSSDPVITAHRKCAQMTRKPFPGQVIDMLEIPQYLQNLQIITDSDSDDSDSDDSDTT